MGAAVQLVLMGGPEYARFVGIKSLQPVGVFLPGTQVYPGGAPFDPAQFSRNPDEFLEQQVRTATARCAAHAVCAVRAVCALLDAPPAPC